MTVEVKVKRLYPDSILPSKATKGSIGFDLFSHHWDLTPSLVYRIFTGIAIELPEGYEGQIRSRSGLASKGITVMNSPGTIDTDYRGELIILLNKLPGQYEMGMRLAQLVIKKVPEVELVEVEELSTTVRGIKGGGSSGI